MVMLWLPYFCNNKVCYKGTALYMVGMLPGHLFLVYVHATYFHFNIELQNFLRGILVHKLTVNVLKFRALRPKHTVQTQIRSSLIRVLPVCYSESCIFKIPILCRFKKLCIAQV